MGFRNAGVIEGGWRGAEGRARQRSGAMAGWHGVMLDPHVGITYVCGCWVAVRESCPGREEESGWWGKEKDANREGGDPAVVHRA